MANDAFCGGREEPGGSGIRLPSVTSAGLSLPGVRDVRDTVVAWLPGLIGFVVLAADGIAGGAYLPRAWRLTTFALLALVAAALIARRRVALAPLERLVLAALALLVVWTTLSARWSFHPHTSVLEGERDVLYFATVAALLVCADRTALPQILAGALAGVTVICGYGLGTYVFIGHEYVPIQGTLLFEPLGYANGLGIYAAIGILLAAGFALAKPSRLARAACLASAAILAPTLYLTSSRAAMVALAVGLVVLLGFGRRVSAPVAALLAAVAAATLVTVVLVQQEPNIVRRLVGEQRPRYWHVAWREYTDHKLLGSGAGTFDEYWLRWRTVPSYARDAHSLYLETLAELGPVGLALLLAALTLPLLALRGGRDPLRATAAAGYVAFLIHAGVDWDWELPATTIAGLLCGSALLVAARGEAVPELSPRARAALLVPALALAIVALVRLRTGPSLPFAP